MGFRDDLRKKIQIKQLTQRIMRSINPNDSAQRIDDEAMRNLLDLGTYQRKKERDLDLYILKNQHILVLDNELKIYNTTAEDIALRKSPTVKEMISIRNAIKILNDKDVVVSRKADTVTHVQAELIDDLDLSYIKADIESMTQDGIVAYQNDDTDGVIDILTLFAELLEYDNAPKAFRMARFHIWGKSVESKTGNRLFGPAIIYGLEHNELKMHKNSIENRDSEALQRFTQMVKGEVEADLSHVAVLDALKTAVLSNPQNSDK